MDMEKILTLNLQSVKVSLHPKTKPQDLNEWQRKW